MLPEVTVTPGNSMINSMNQWTTQNAAQQMTSWSPGGNGNNSSNVQVPYASAGMIGDIFTSFEKHFNGSIGTIGVAVQGYENLSNNIKRAYAYKLSKMTGIKSGQIFQGAKGFANSTGKLVSKLGPAGTLLGVGVAG